MFKVDEVINIDSLLYIQALWLSDVLNACRKVVYYIVFKIMVLQLFMAFCNHAKTYDWQLLLSLVRMHHVLVNECGEKMGDAANLLI